MNRERDDQNEVSQLYVALNKAEESLEPAADLDNEIRSAATRAVDSDRVSLFRRYLVPLSIAASLFVVVGIVMKLSYLDSHAVQIQGVSELKKPMFLMQRSKPAASEVMIGQLENFLNEGRIDKARLIHQKLRYYYPDVQLVPELVERLRAEKIQ